MLLEQLRSLRITAFSLWALYTLLLREPQAKMYSHWRKDLFAFGEGDSYVLPLELWLAGSCFIKPLTWLTTRRWKMFVRDEGRHVARHVSVVGDR